jgi:hypothetical protein
MKRPLRRIVGAATINLLGSLLLAGLIFVFIASSRPDNEGGLGLALLWASFMIGCSGIVSIVVSPFIVEAIQETRNPTFLTRFRIFLFSSSIAVFIGGLIAALLFAVVLARG